MHTILEKLDRLIESLGTLITSNVVALGDFALLSFQALVWTLRGKISRKVLTAQLNEIGVNSLFMVFITSLFTGLVLVVQIGKQFQSINGEMFVGGTVGLSLARELAPLVTGVVIAGRIGSAMAAELGTMKVTEQVDALLCLSTNPVAYLVVPRVLACTIMVPVLTVFSNIVGILGGALAAVAQVGITITTFNHSVRDFVTTDDFVSGIAKAVVFGVIIGLIACYKGLTCRGGAEGVGRATTGAVVSTVVMLLITNYFLSVLFFTYQENITQ